MALFKDFAERAAEKEAKQAEEVQRERDRRESFVAETVAEVGMNLADLDDAALNEAILSGVARIESGIAEHEYSRSFTDVLHGENELAGDDLIRILVNQNRVIIQQNELITRLLEKLR